MLCHVYEFEVWTWRTWLRNLSSAIFEKKPSYNHKQIFWHCCSNLLFVNCIFLGYSSLNIRATIRDLKLKGMPKYKQVWTWHIDLFTLCLWLAQNFMKICFRNMGSAKLEWKERTRRIKHDCFYLYYGWLKLHILFSTSLDLFFYFFFVCFLFCFFCCFFLPITAICLVS